MVINSILILAVAALVLWLRIDLNRTKDKLDMAVTLVAVLNADKVKEMIEENGGEDVSVHVDVGVDGDAYKVTLTRKKKEGDGGET